MPEEKKLLDKSEVRETKPVLGYILIALGVVFLLERMFRISLFYYVAWRYIWPLLLILAGVYLVRKKSQ